MLLVVGAAAALIVALTGGHKQSGFLGTNASRAADLNLLLHGVMVLAILVGAHLGHVGDIAAHRINQTIVVLANLVSIASVMLVSLFRVVVPSASTPGDPMVAVAGAHGLLGLVTEGLGIYLLLRMNNLIPPRWRFRNFKLMMRATLVQWVIVTVYGGALYWVWYAPAPNAAPGEATAQPQAAAGKPAAAPAAPAASAQPAAGAPANPVGLVGFRDDQARADQVVVDADGLAPPAAGTTYVAWLSVGGKPTLRLGPLTLSGGRSASLVASSPERANLLGAFNGLQLSAEPTGSAAAAPADVRYRAELPPKAASFLRLALGEMAGAPDNTPAAVGVLEQSQALRLHAGLARLAARGNDVAGVQRHAEHLVNVIEGQRGPNFGDRNADGRVQNPGDGFGLLEAPGQPGYLKSLADAAAQAAAAEDANATIKVHAGHVQVAVENARAAAVNLRDVVLEAARPQNTARAAQLAEQILALAEQAAIGVDANANGQIEPVAGEGGAKVAYIHAQFMATMSLLPTGASLSPAAPAVLPVQPGPAELAAQPTPPPALPPVSASPGTPVALDIANFQFGGKGLNIKVGTPITWTNKDRAPHTVTADDKQFNSGNLAAGQSFSFTPSSAGSFPYFCELHGEAGGQGMSGVLTVVR